MKESILRKIDWLVLPAIGVAICILAWNLIAGKEVRKETLDDFGDKVVKVQRVGVSGPSLAGRNLDEEQALHP